MALPIKVEREVSAVDRYGNVHTVQIGIMPTGMHQAGAPGVFCGQHGIVKLAYRNRDNIAMEHLSHVHGAPRRIR
ncbi:hypothetical protein ABZW18_20800 [Streptomyces sp. NPDC004647]|uniref:hypothetical protein n=1 Tax=Streptomyces sp. NPDC004647 TaxID=3154671 RepID=UPI0033AC1066